MEAAPAGVLPCCLSGESGASPPPHCLSSAPHSAPVCFSAAGTAQSWGLGGAAAQARETSFLQLGRHRCEQSENMFFPRGLMQNRAAFCAGKGKVYVLRKELPASPVSFSMSHSSNTWEWACLPISLQAFGDQRGGKTAQFL